MEQASQPLYRVKRIEPAVIYVGDGPPVDGQRVDFAVAGAPDQYILVPNSDFEPGHVDALIGQWAAKVAATLSLEGPLVTMDANGAPQLFPPE